MNSERNAPTSKLRVWWNNIIEKTNTEIEMRKEFIELNGKLSMSNQSQLKIIADAGEASEEDVIAAEEKIRRY